MKKIKKALVSSVAALSLLSVQFNNALITNAVYINGQSYDYSNVTTEQLEDFTTSKLATTVRWNYGDFKAGHSRIDNNGNPLSESTACPIAGCYQYENYKGKKSKILITPGGDIYFYNYLMSKFDIEYSGASKVVRIYNTKTEGQYVVFIDATNYWDLLSDNSKPKEFKGLDPKSAMEQGNYFGLYQSLIFKPNNELASQVLDLISAASFSNVYKRKIDYSHSYSDFNPGDVVSGSYYNGIVDTTDLTALNDKIVFGTHPNDFAPINADLNFDGNSNAMDIVILKKILMHVTDKEGIINSYFRNEQSLPNKVY